MKKHGHENKHAHCEHCLHFCGHCDTVYCCDCSREWGICHRTHYPWYTSTIPCSSGTTSDTLNNITFTASADDVATGCAHVHA